MFSLLIFASAKKKYEINSRENVEFSELKSGKSFSVSRIVVVNPNNFSFVLRDDSKTKIMGKFDVIASEDSKSRILELLNSCESPKITLLNKSEDGIWTVDLSMMQNENTINFKDWLLKNNLVYK
jgi:hypothetical protein